MIARLAVAVSLIFFATLSSASPLCNISREKSAPIKQVACGQSSGEPAYQFEGRDCAKRSLSKRIEDSALQIYLVRLCGYWDLADDLRRAHIMLAKTMEPLALCSGSYVDLVSVFEDKEKYVENRARGLSCTEARRSQVEQRLDFYRQMAAAYSDPEYAQKLYSSLGIVVEDDGSVEEK